MSFDEEYIDPHGECAAEIHRLQKQLASAQSQAAALAQALRQIAETGDVLVDVDGEENVKGKRYSMDFHKSCCDQAREALAKLSTEPDAGS